MLRSARIEKNSSGYFLLKRGLRMHLLGPTRGGVLASPFRCGAQDSLGTLRARLTLRSTGRQTPILASSDLRALRVWIWRPARSGLRFPRLAFRCSVVLACGPRGLRGVRLSPQATRKPPIGYPRVPVPSSPRTRKDNSKWKIL